MARAALANVDIRPLLDAKSHEEFVAYRRVAVKAIELAGEQRDDLAKRTINALAEALDKGSRRSSSSGAPPAGARGGYQRGKR